jgi:hypothetical protein
MPTEAHIPEIHTIATAYSGDSMILAATATSGGVLVRYDRRYGTSPAPALEAVGYTTTAIRQGLVLVTGTVDPIALLDAQIAALQARRAELLEQLTGAPF